MYLLVFILVMLVLIDHAMRYRSQALVFYKNDHRLSVIVAITRLDASIDNLLELAKHSKHEFIFVGVNGAIDARYDPDVTILETTAESRNGPDDISALNVAYRKGYREATQEYLLFMAVDRYFESAKLLDHIANNLVEHQVYTLKETYPFRPPKEGYKFFFDIFREMNIDSDSLNYSFFAIKRETFELADFHQTPYDAVDAFEERLAKKNINLIHIHHEGALRKHDRDTRMRPFLTRWLHDFVRRRRNSGIRRMLLLLLSLHLFYVFIVLDFTWLNLGLLVVVHVAFWWVFHPYMRQHLLQYVLIPFYLLFFDALFLVGIGNRAAYRLKEWWRGRHEE